MFEFILVVLGFGQIFSQEEQNRNLKGTVYLDEKGKSVFQSVIDPKGACSGHYRVHMEELGWDFLTIEGSKLPEFSEEQVFYSCGYLEGKLSATQIGNYVINLNHYTFEEKDDFLMPQNVQAFFKEQKKYTEEMIKSNPGDPFYSQMKLAMKQVEGIIDGYNEYAVTNSLPTVTWETYQVIQSTGDVGTIISSLHPDRFPIRNMTSDELSKYFEESNRCSSLVKVLPETSDINIMFAHTTWGGYTTQYRVFKEYKFSTTSVDGSHQKRDVLVQFSSYPGMTVSDDDYYVTSHNLGVLETTNSILNDTLYELITPRSLLYWQRVYAANILSESPEKWMKYVSTNPSGTYNCQWMVIDLENGTFYVGEEMPGKFHYADQTETLLKEPLYWASYNVPFYPDIYDEMGYKDALEKHPELSCKLSYDHCARAEIFRRDNVLVKDLESMKRMIRYNDYKHDAVSLNDSTLTIASRSELSTKFAPSCHGAIDAKISSSKLWKHHGGTSIIISGPVKGGGSDIPVFEWSNPQVIQACPSDKNIHLMMPQKCDFEWIDFKNIYL